MFIKLLLIFLLSFVWLLIDSLFSVGFLAKKNIIRFYLLMNTGILIIFALAGVGLNAIRFRDLIEELLVEYKSKLF